MLTYEECVGFTDFCEEDVAFLAEHEHMPEMVACELATCLQTTPEGLRTLRRFMEEDLVLATRKHKRERVAVIGRVISRFDQQHPGLS